MIARISSNYLSPTKDTILILAIAAVLIVLLFDYANGFHDAASIFKILQPIIILETSVGQVEVYDFCGAGQGVTRRLTARDAKERKEKPMDR